MLAEFVQKLTDLAREADAVEVIGLQGDPRTVLVRQGGSTQERTIPPPLRAHKIRAFDDFCAAVKDSVICTSPEIYFQFAGALAFCCRSDRLETISLPIESSQQWAALVKLDSGATFSPKYAINFLRFELGSDVAAVLIAGLRRIDFKRSSAGSHVNEHGKESLGRSVEAAVQKADEVPETCDVTISPARNSGLKALTVKARLGIAIDFDQERIMLKLLPDELSAARESFVRQVGTMLVQALPGVPCFNGSVS
ncbi:MAG: hypothetical protein EPN91_05290 [Salinibacterium sp.]|nr:MAG: hypothetical protein EPN91_05290 [Salinibacterium sp.]